MQDLIHTIEKFLGRFCSTDQPLLLGLSGGADSLCLFYCLLACQKKKFFPLHVAHIDHGWRPESPLEATELQCLAAQYEIPFFCKKLDPTTLKGNLEEACRIERYRFFNELSTRHAYQGVLLGHHRDDQAETVLKRLLEGAHWSQLSGLRFEKMIDGIRVLRPFLSVSKGEIREWLTSHAINPFEDQTNNDTRFLRARLRQTVIPWLNQNFGKQVSQSLCWIGEEAGELRDYFDERIHPIMAECVQSPLGIYLDLQQHPSLKLIELKYLLRKLCENQRFFISRPMVESGAKFLEQGIANRLLKQGSHSIWIDRKRIFISTANFSPVTHSISIQPGQWNFLNWKVEVTLASKNGKGQTTSWKEGWLGEWSTLLPEGEYRLAPSKANALYLPKGCSLNQWWLEREIPAFLRQWIPVIEGKNGVFHEFLTGFTSPGEKENQWLIKLIHMP